ncbi:MAG: TRAP transporter large permease subunit, partial [Gammaproteobacteria bacterium]|nr:TRAP transporter large permease subunit [Gammaproteobacteria bacterium]
MNAGQRIEDAFATLIRWMNGAGVAWIFALMFLICADITGRTLFARPIQAVPEIVAFSLVGCVFLQLAYAVQTHRLTHADVLLDYIRQRQPAAGLVLQVATAGMGCFVLSVIAIGAWPDFWRAFDTGEFTGVEGIYTLPIAPIKFTVVLGAVIAALEYLRQFGRRSASAARSGRSARVLLAAVALLGLLTLATALMQAAELADQVIGGLAIVTVLVFIAVGVPIAVALLLTGFAGLALLKRDFGIATDTLSLAAQGTVAEYVFATVPLFVLMGLFVSVSEIGRDSFRAAQQAFGRIRGGLGVATVAANAVFAAITGISIASAAIFAKIAVPEMVARGYTAKFAVGLTAGSSVLGMLIPPSLLLIIYGVIAEVSIGALFLAAIVPGIILAVAFACSVILMARFWPDFVGEINTDTGDTDSETVSDFLRAVFPVFLLKALVMGGIYGGIFTPTEAGAAGALAAMCLALIKRR